MILFFFGRDLILEHFVHTGQVCSILSRFVEYTPQVVLRVCTAILQQKYKQIRTSSTNGFRFARVKGPGEQPGTFDFALVFMQTTSHRGGVWLLLNSRVPLKPVDQMLRQVSFTFIIVPITSFYKVHCTSTCYLKT